MLIARYAHWLHTRWPAGKVEPLPEIGPDGATAVPGVYVSGDLTGIPLLKFALDTGAKTVQRIGRDLAPHGGGTLPDSGTGERSSDVRDLVIVGAGVSGMAAAIEAQKRASPSRSSSRPSRSSTIVNFPKAKPIYTYPSAMMPAGTLQVSADVKEPLVEELRRQGDAAGIAAAPRAGRARRAQSATVSKSTSRAASLSSRAACSSRSGGAAISGCWACRARISTRSRTGSTTRTTSRGRTCWSWAAATRRSRPRSRSPRQEHA